MKKLLLIGIIVLSACGPQKPDYVDKDGKEYFIVQHCVKSHTESNYGYHYGYNMMEGKFNWHYGLETETICDSTKLDTIEINIDKKYYSHK